jgi:hypothetical protein
MTYDIRAKLLDSSGEVVLTMELQGDRDGPYQAIHISEPSGEQPLLEVVFSGTDASMFSSPWVEGLDGMDVLATVADFEPPNLWVTASRPGGATAMREECSWRADGQCWCQCITDAWYDYFACSEIKYLAYLDGEDVDNGFQYTDSDGSKCPPKPTPQG